MKKILIIAIVFLAAFGVAELFVRYIVGYPVYGVKYKVHYRKSGEYWTNIWKPYSRYWNVESGNKVFQRNNLGLPGIEIKTDARSNLAILGTSFIEAYQVKPELMATSVLSRLLSNSNKNTAVYNLGYSGHDPYELWYRIKYFERQYPFEKVILVLETDFSTRWGRYNRSLSFEFNSKFGLKNESFATKLLIKLRNISAFNSLIVNGLRSIRFERRDGEKFIQGERSLKLTPELEQCLLQFYQDYDDNFGLVSITEDKQFNDDLASFCAQYKINFYNKPIVRQEIMIKGLGHLNEQGNKEMGLLLYKAYNKFWSK